jgi:hypothetical protein
MPHLRKTNPGFHSLVSRRLTVPVFFLIGVSAGIADAAQLGIRYERFAFFID